MPDLTRRQYLRGTAAAATAGLAAAGTGQTATAQRSVPAFDPEFVAEADFPRQLLESYQPVFVSSSETRQQLSNIYAWRAKPAADAPTDLEALYYWLQYAVQDHGWELFAHYMDHEPLIVYRDPGSGAVEAVVYTGYHHLAAARFGTRIPLVEDRRPFETHARLRIVDSFHHYNAHYGDEAAGFLASQVGGLEDWLTAAGGRDEWYRNGTLANTARAAVDDPFAMFDRRMWWAEGTDDAYWAQTWADLAWAPSLGALPSPAQADPALRV